MELLNVVESIFQLGLSIIFINLHGEWNFKFFQTLKTDINDLNNDILIGAVFVSIISIMWALYNGIRSILSIKELMTEIRGPQQAQSDQSDDSGNISLLAALNDNDEAIELRQTV